MIEISITAAAAFYSLILLAGMLAAWIYTEIHVQRAQIAMARQNVWRCTYCAFSYLDEEAIRLSQCPRCGSINTATGKEVSQAVMPDGEMETALEDAQPPPRRNPSHQKRPGARTHGPRRRR